MKKYLFTSESVTKGHPDKLCDLISDTILDECLKQDSNSRVAVEVLASRNQITVAGQITSFAEINIEQIVRNVIKDIGYNNESTDIDYRTCKVEINVTKQSNDIAQGVNIGGAGDQGIMFGYACNETPELMPYPIVLAHKLAMKLEEVRTSREIPYLRPDGKVQVTIEYENDKPKRIDTILISTQHTLNVTQEEIKKDIINKVINQIVDKSLIDDKTKYHINPTGSFIIGGPLGDTGLTGRKIIVDTYGGYARHGGGAFSGKDATKVDRSAAYMARHIAKCIVTNKMADKCEIQLSYGIGIKEPISININTYGTNKIDEDIILEKVNRKFDLTPNGIISYLKLQEPIYTKTTNYGHFGKEFLPWEKVVEL